MPDFDLIFTNGWLVDGIHPEPYHGLVAVNEDRIAYIGAPLSDVTAKNIIDAQGYVICPGFIDIHTHSDLSALSYPQCTNKIFQGVTTEVIGNCGFSTFPVHVAHRHKHEQLMQMVDGSGLPIDWHNLDGYARRAERAAPALNIAPLVGHGALRIAAVDEVECNQSVTDTRKKMLHLLQESFEQGAFGFTTGLTYTPSGLAPQDELLELIECTVRYDRLYATHSRAGGDTSESEALSEAADHACRTDVRFQYSHLAINQPSQWGNADKVLARFHRLIDEGIDIAYDIYPYEASSSALIQHLPMWIQDDELATMRSRLADPQTRRSVIEALRKSWWGGCEGRWMWDRFIVSATPVADDLIGRSIAELAAETGVSGEEMVLQLCESFGNQLHIVLHYRMEDDVRHFIQDDLSVIGSDGLALPERIEQAHPHPRSYGTFPRVLGYYVRDKSVLSLNAAIHKMTAAPADRLLLRDRGRLKAGNFADIVVIDPDRIRDRATYVNPTLRPEGVMTVVVNGQVVMNDGQQTGSRPGRVLRFNE
ncbi:MAG: amidohydrolase family protein [Phycisphaeraceae bacterium]